jgi:hypothetical protein
MTIKPLVQSLYTPTLSKTRFPGNVRENLAVDGTTDISRLRPAQGSSLPPPGGRR